MFFLPGVAGFLFVPMAEAVMFAMIASFVLSRTLVPTMAKYLLVPHGAAMTSTSCAAARRASRPTSAQSAGRGSSTASSAASNACAKAIAACWRWRWSIAACFVVGFLAASSPRSRWCRSWARTSFRRSMPGRSTCMCARRSARASRRPPRLFDHVEASDPQTYIPPKISWTRSSTTSACRSAASTAPTATPAASARGRRHLDHAWPRTIGRPRTMSGRCASVCRRAFPGSTFSFLPADIISQILNFGAPAPIDVQVAGPDSEANEAYAGELLRRHRKRCPASPTCGCSSPPTIRSSASTSTAPGPANSASPNATSPTAWWSTSPAASRPRRPSGSTARTGSPIRSSSRPRSTMSTRLRTGEHPAHRQQAARLQVLGGLGDHPSRGQRRGGLPLRHPAGLRHLCDHPGPRPGRRRGDIQKVLEATAKDLPQGRDRHPARPGRDHEHGLLRPVLRPGRGDRADLSADRRQLPVLDRSLRHHHRLARRAGRHRLDAVRHPHHA